MTITNLLRSISKLLMKKHMDVLKLKPDFVIIFLIRRSTHEGPVFRSLAGSPPRRTQTWEVQRAGLSPRLRFSRWTHTTAHHKALKAVSKLKRNRSSLVAKTCLPLNVRLLNSGNADAPSWELGMVLQESASPCAPAGCRNAQCRPPSGILQPQLLTAANRPTPKPNFLLLQFRVQQDDRLGLREIIYY